MQKFKLFFNLTENLIFRENGRVWVFFGKFYFVEMWINCISERDKKK